MKKQNHFIATTDPATAEMLRNLGFQELTKQGNRWMFLNEQGKITFSSDDMKMNFTDILTF